MTLAEYQEFSAQHHREWNTAPAVLHFNDGREPLVGTLERQTANRLLFESQTQKVTIFRKNLTALDYGDRPGQLRFTVENLPLETIVFTPARELGWIYWAAGR
ncbi:hypothetical protein ACIRU3_31425 [Streptomyces sp. NPDC101151]|uniref:hypothetical protein n=1 Tax=Streptomyces sp. NPDC101151 TaxID=3366115 RepID=UPI0037FC5AFF